MPGSIYSYLFYLTWTCAEKNIVEHANRIVTAAVSIQTHHGVGSGQLSGTGDSAFACHWSFITSQVCPAREAWSLGYDTVKRSCQDLQAVEEAWAVLSNATTRKQFDQELLRQATKDTGGIVDLFSVGAAEGKGSICNILTASCLLHASRVQKPRQLPR